MDTSGRKGAGGRRKSCSLVRLSPRWRYPDVYNIRSLGYYTAPIRGSQGLVDEFRVDNNAVVVGAATLDPCARAGHQIEAAGCVTVRQ